MPTVITPSIAPRFLRTLLKSTASLCFLLAACSLTACGSDDPGSDGGGEAWKLNNSQPPLDFGTPDDISPDAPDLAPPEEDMEIIIIPEDMKPPAPDMRGEPIGAACDEALACEGNACLAGDRWPNGYCSQTPCDERDCAAIGGICVADATRGEAICAAYCDSQGDCRDGYVCRGDDSIAGGVTMCLPPVVQDSTPDGGACTSNDDCAGGTCISDADGWPDGYCTTTNCSTREDCARDGGFDNRCYQNPRGPNICVRICERAADCRDQYVCQPVGGGLGFCVPDPNTPIAEDFSSYPFPITCEAPGTRSYSVDYTIDASTSAYMLTMLARDGSNVLPRETSLPSGSSIDYRSANAFQLATAQLFGAVSPLVTPATPDFTNQLESGTHTLSMQTDSGDLCSYLLQEDSAGTTIDMNIYFVGVPGVSASTAPMDANIQQTLQQFDTIYASSNIQRGTVRYYDITGQDAQSYQIIRSRADMSELVSRTSLPGTTYDDALSINIFFVRSFAMQGGAIGTSLGLPGPAGLHGTRASGVVFTSEFLGSQFVDRDGTRVNGNDYTGVVLAHEVGHYLGLFHTTEANNRGQDPLQDTPICNNQPFPDGCPDLNNLMFPLAGITHTNVSADQTFVIGANPLTKD